MAAGEATTISHILVQAITIVLPGEKHLLYGPALPHRLESHSDVLWAVKAELIEEGPISVSLYCGHSKPIDQQYLLNRPNISTYEWITLQNTHRQEKFKPLLNLIGIK